LQGQYDDRQLLPQFVLIFGRAAEFGNLGPHKRPDRLRKKRDFMRRSDEQFMTFDSLKPNREFSDFITISMTVDGPELYAVPPSFTSGPLTADIAGVLRDAREAIFRTEMRDDDRKAYVLDRWLHWQHVVDAPDDLNDIPVSSMQRGE
jgi:hypothetical protein